MILNQKLTMSECLISTLAAATVQFVDYSLKLASLFSHKESSLIRHIRKRDYSLSELISVAIVQFLSLSKIDIVNFDQESPSIQ